MFRNKLLRTKYLIYPSFQLTLIGVNLLTVTALGAAVYWASLEALTRLKHMGIEAGLNQKHAYFKLISLQQEFILNSIAVSTCICILCSVFLTLYLSHRLAGPIVKLKRVFEKIAETGETQFVQFRKGDFFSDLPSEINKAFERLKAPKTERTLPTEKSKGGKEG